MLQDMSVELIHDIGCSAAFPGLRCPTLANECHPASSHDIAYVLKSVGRNLVAVDVRDESELTGDWLIVRNFRTSPLVPVSARNGDIVIGAHVALVIFGPERDLSSVTCQRARV